MAVPVFPAHIREDGAVQSVQAHCRSAARLAAAALQTVSLGESAYLAGLLHDMGKFTAAFRAYIQAGVQNGDAARGSVVHSFAGARFLLMRGHRMEPGPFSLADLTAELLAYAVGGHHGLFDVLDEEGASGFRRRLEAHQEHYPEAEENFLAYCASGEEIDQRFRRAEREIENISARLRTLPAVRDPESANDEMYFHAGLLCRLLLSAVIEGDRRDTAAFMLGEKPPEPAPAPPWEEMRTHLEAYLMRFPHETGVERARSRISKACADFGVMPSGVYRLHVPTGGGKTLSALRFALKHARTHRKRRILYCAPLITILEQNAQVIRDALGRPEWVLEHHSNIVREAEEERDIRRELMMASWDAPVIVTTLVQFLDTLFSHKTGCVRRFQALCGSVILLDEVQTVPTKLLSLFNLAVNFLSGVCGATVLLCSATQPCLEETPHPLRVRPETPALGDESVFRRTVIRPAPPMREEEIASFVMEQMADAESLLVICNKKSQAAALTGRLADGPWQTFHLSAALCPAHRRRVLKELEEALAASKQGGAPALCVSTQVIEAGVDISFSRVIRLCAGMDSVLQAAGRCNRHGEKPGRAAVYLLPCADERLKGLPEIQEGKAATEALLDAFGRSPERFSGDLASDEAIRFYYRTLYAGKRAGAMDMPDAPAGVTLLDLLARNRPGGQEEKLFFLRQAFRTAGRRFTVFGEDTLSVLVPYGEGRAIIEELSRLDPKWALGAIRSLLRRAHPYVVSVYAHQAESLLRCGALRQLCGGAVLALAEGCYDETLGLTNQPLNDGFLEV